MRELAHHVLDLVENAVTAGADCVEIRVHEDTTRDRLVLEVADNGSGMDRDMVRMVRDPFVTSRTVRRVGLGISLLEAAAEACGGELAIESEPGVGTTVTAAFQRSHVDRAPLGDMGSTLASVLILRPETRIVYRHCVDGLGFTLDTAEIAALLGEVPMNHIDVLQWVRRACADSLRNLYGGEDL